MTCSGRVTRTSGLVTPFAGLISLAGFVAGWTTGGRAAGAVAGLVSFGGWRCVLGDSAEAG